MANSAGNMWKCKSCTFENCKNENVCEVCNCAKGATADVGKADEFNQNATFKTTPQKSHGQPKSDQPKSDDGNCFLCGAVEPTELKPCERCQKKNFCHECNKRYHDHPHRRWHLKELNEITVIPDDVNIIASLLKEIERQYDDAKSVMETANRLIEQTSQDKKHMTEQLNDAKSHIEIELSLNTKNEMEEEKKTLKRKLKRLLNDRETQWTKRQQELHEDFKNDRKIELMAIAERWRALLQDETKNGKSKSVLKKEPQDSDLKSDRDLKLKMKVLKIIWEAREDFEWEAYRQNYKAQWDLETNKQEHDIKDAGEDRDRVKEVTKKITNKQKICKIKIDDISNSSSALNSTTKTLQEMEGRMSKVSERWPELSKKIVDVYEKVQQQEKSLKTQKKINQKNILDLNNVSKEIDALKQNQERERDEWKTKNRTLEKETLTLQARIKDLTFEKDSINKKLNKVQQQLKSLTEEQETWKSQRQQFLAKELQLKKVVADWQSRSDAEVMGWQDMYEALNSSECQVLKKNEALTEELEDLKQEIDHLKTLSDQENVKNQLENNMIVAQTQTEMTEYDELNSSESQLLKKNKELTEELEELKQEIDHLKTLSNQENVKNQLENMTVAQTHTEMTKYDASGCALEASLDDWTKLDKLEQVPDVHQEFQGHARTQLYSQHYQYGLLGADGNPSTSRVDEVYADHYNKTPSRICPIDRKISESEIPTEILQNTILPGLLEINLLVIGDCTSWAQTNSSRLIIINALANYIRSNSVPRTFDDPPAPFIEYDIQKIKGQSTLVFSDKDLHQQEFNLTVPWLNGCTFRFIQSTHPLSGLTADLSIQEMLQVFSEKQCIHGIIVAHYQTSVQPLPTKLLSLIHKNAAKNLIFIEGSLNDHSLMKSLLSSITNLPSNPRVFHRYNEFRENYIRWIIAHHESNKGTLERMQDSWCASADKWRKELTRMISTEVVPHQSRESLAVTKAWILCKDNFEELIDGLKDFRTNDCLTDNVSKLIKQIDEFQPNDPQRQHLRDEINRLTGEYESRDNKIRSLLTQGIMLDNYLKDNAIISEKTTLKQRIEQTYTGIVATYKPTLNSGLKDYLKKFFDSNQELRFSSIEEILNLEIVSRV